MIQLFPDLIQGSDAWLAARCGILTASQMKDLITPTGKVAKNDGQRILYYELLAQRITRHIDPQYMSDDMLRGQEEEVTGRILYDKTYARVTSCGFIINDEFGFPLGYSPDGLVGTDGLIEVKSRRAKYQIATLLKNEVPLEYALQIQTGLFVSGRQWCDFISYSAGLPMLTIRVLPDPVLQDVISQAFIAFERWAETALDQYLGLAHSPSPPRLIPTERRDDLEITL